eukprot:CAMPEP_0194221510 /NCGR_PEP_ID=MMETSP0156-20130528/30736_1 /TAXON_ID=33649 /ORGANISM="Thalassionema nitzschioides, Strain L26-B" /LENGTH=38 /DNA_ID= /DNA_START= /DNA_END= /DNA_ORIENTATION=
MSSLVSALMLALKLVDLRALRPSSPANICSAKESLGTS